MPLGGSPAALLRVYTPVGEVGFCGGRDHRGFGLEVGFVESWPGMWPSWISELAERSEISEVSACFDVSAISVRSEIGCGTAMAKTQW